MRRAFTLVEMIVVIGIISVLVSVGIVTFGRARANAETGKARELVSQVATALAAIYNADGVWPKLIREASESDGLVDNRVAYVLASRGVMSVTYDGDAKRATGNDRFGIVSPWATDVIKRLGRKATESTIVSRDYRGASRTIKDHLLHFKVDLDGDGVIESVNLGDGGDSIDIRANVAVWCAGKDGKMEAYREGLKRDDVYSWDKGQTRNVR